MLVAWQFGGQLKVRLLDDQFYDLWLLVMDLAVVALTEQLYLGVALQGVAVCSYDRERDHPCRCCKSVVLDC